MIDWNKTTALYADGGLIGPKNPSDFGVTWAWCAVDTYDNLLGGESGVYIASDGIHTNNRAEYLAACKALAAVPEGWTGGLYLDSQVTLGRLFWGWKNTNIPEAWVKRALEELIPRLGKLWPVLLHGHPTAAELAAGIGAGGLVSKHNVWCDEQCKLQSQKYLKEHSNGVRTLEQKAPAATPTVRKAQVAVQQNRATQSARPLVHANSRAVQPLRANQAVAVAVDQPPPRTCSCPNRNDAVMCLLIRTGQERRWDGTDEECGCYCHDEFEQWARGEEDE